MTAKPQMESTEVPAIDWSYRAFLADKAENTRRAYQLDLLVFARWSGEADSLNAIRNLVAQGFAKAMEEAARYCEWLFEHSGSRKTAKRRLASFKSLISQLQQDGVILWSLPVTAPPPTALDRHRQQEYESLRPSSDTLARLAAEVRKRDTNAGLRDRLIVYFVSVLLLRNVELAHLLVTDIDWRANQLLVRGSMEPDRRGGRPRVRQRRVPIPDAIIRDLEAWVAIASATGAQHLFLRMRCSDRVTDEPLSPIGFYWIVRDWCDRLGIERLTTRRVRESGIRSMLEQTREHNVSPADVADIAGISHVNLLRPHWKRGNADGQRTAVEAAMGAIGPR